MFSRNLYDHVYDIDDLIAALCGCAPDGTPHNSPSLLSTRTGQLTPLTAGTTNLPEDATHQFLLHPLSPAVLTTFLKHPHAKKLASEDQRSLHDLITTTTSLAPLVPLFQQHNRTGAFLRERFKEIAMEWLDEHNLIPPSMRHVKDAAGLFDAPTLSPGGRVALHSPGNDD